jgi:6-pyruvoyltetrahydropterin/6-carboxytetrahydropterin synthase
MEIYKEFKFDSAHFLPNLPEDHKCRRMHGHTFRVRIYVEGPLTVPEGWVLDFGDLKAIYKPLEDQLDHRLLNDIPGLENPTSEVLAKWVWDKLMPDLPLLSKIEVSETCTTGCIYTGEK